MDGIHYIAAPEVDDLSDVAMTEAQHILHTRLMAYVPRLRAIDLALTEELQGKDVASPDIEHGTFLHLRHVCRHTLADISGRSSLRPDRTLMALQELLQLRPEIDSESVDPRFCPHPVIRELCETLQTLSAQYPELNPPETDDRFAVLMARVKAARARSHADLSAPAPPDYPSR